MSQTETRAKTGRGAPGRPRSTPTPDATRPYGRELKRIREVLGLTQLEMAAALGFTGPTTISRYERGERQVAEPILRLARTLCHGVEGSAAAGRRERVTSLG